MIGHISHRYYPNLSLDTFCKTLQNLLNHGQVVDIVLKDFNINALNCTNDSLRHVFTHALLVSEPTQISDSLIGHVYFSKNLMKKFLVEKK